ncbi:YqgE/AlgH family protein [Magnetospira thiophila]
MSKNETLDLVTLSGQLLVAMPGIGDPRFERSVIYICAHGPEGAMGLVINRVMDSFTLPDLLEQLDIDPIGVDERIRVHVGGPVDTGRGFVLHSADYFQDSTLRVDGDIALTATVDILRAIAHGHGPDRSLLALGYAGWGPGQLDDEILANGWLNLPGDSRLIFDPDTDHKWEQALARLGIDSSLLSLEAGHA